MSRKKLLFLSGMMMLFIVGATIHATQSVMLSSYIETYSLKAGMQGFSVSIQEIGLILSLFLSAVLLRKYSKPKILLFMSMLMNLSIIGLGCKPPFWLLCLFYMFFGLSFGSIDSLASSFISDTFREKSAIPMSYVRAFYSVGGIIVPLILNLLLSKGFAWNRVILIAAGACTLLISYFVLVSYPHMPMLETDNVHKDRISLSELTAYLSNKGALTIIFIGFFYSMHQIGLTVWIVRFLEEYRGMAKIGSYVLSAYWMGVLVSRLVISRIIYRCRTVLVWGPLLAGIFISAELFVDNVAASLILMVLTGLSEGLLLPMIVDYACGIDRTRSALTCSTIILVNNVGGMIAPSLVGLLISIFSPNFGISILPFTMFICFGSAIFLFRGGKPCQTKCG